MASRTGTFTGASVFLSRSLVPPEVFDAIHDALRLNGAQVFLCCDPCRNSLNEYHVISSIDHEKFDDLRSKGCNLLGPQCILSCAKERRVLPKQGYTCCLAMDGVKVLASGFENDEKATIEKLVTAMGRVLYSKASLDADFVIVKNVRTLKYKVNGLWQTKNENMANLCKEAKVLKDKFLSFKISHVLREFNSAADEQANLGVGLCNGQVQEECGEPY